MALAVAPSAPARGGKLKKSKWHIILPFTLPSLLLFLVFLVYPYGQAMHISLTKWRGLTPKPT